MLNRLLFDAEEEPCSVVHVLLLFAPADGDVATVGRAQAEPEPNQNLGPGDGDNPQMDGLDGKHAFNLLRLNHLTDKEYIYIYKIFFF